MNLRGFLSEFLVVSDVVGQSIPLITLCKDDDDELQPDFGINFCFM